MNELVSLKQRIDAIIYEEILKGKDALIESWKVPKRIMWRCGLEVLKDYPELETREVQRGGRGVVEPISWSSVAKEIEKPDITIKRWIDLVKKIKRDYSSNFEKYIEVESQKMFERWRLSLLPPPKKETPPLPDYKYPILYADPPWKYDIDIDRKPVDKHYQTMDLQELIDFGEKVKEIQASDCVLFMWTTSAKYDWSIPVMKAWGFDYKSSLVWDKVDYNMGYYFSIRHELLLVGGKGRSAPSNHKTANSIDSIISIPKSSIHSQKPEKIREIIDLLYPEGRALEMFSKANANELPERWDVWGLEAVARGENEYVKS